jgi:hypothetical protein
MPLHETGCRSRRAADVLLRRALCIGASALWKDSEALQVLLGQETHDE